jgi:hypothetical protein
MIPTTNNLEKQRQMQIQNKIHKKNICLAHTILNRQTHLIYYKKRSIFKVLH